MFIYASLNTNRLHRLFEVGQWLAQESMKLLYVINLPKPIGYFTYCQIYNPKILHGVHIALCVLYGTYTLLTDWSLITEVESVYCAVHTESSYKTDCVPFLRLVLTVV